MNFDGFQQEVMKMKTKSDNIYPDLTKKKVLAILFDYVKTDKDKHLGCFNKFI